MMSMITMRSVDFLEIREIGVDESRRYREGNDTHASMRMRWSEEFALHCIEEMRLFQIQVAEHTPLRHLVQTLQNDL